MFFSSTVWYNMILISLHSNIRLCKNIFNQILNELICISSFPGCVFLFNSIKNNYVHQILQYVAAARGDAWHELHLISLQVFHDTEHNLHQLGAESSLLHKHLGGIHTCTDAHITSGWGKIMMTNNYVFQGQTYTNWVGVMPQWMMDSFSDLCSM